MNEHYYDPETNEQMWATWNQAFIDNLVPDESQMLIHVCPCCGYGRTLFVHVQKEPDLIIPADFTKWCNSCRNKIASKANL